jgi:hypothetical protein
VTKSTCRVLRVEKDDITGVFQSIFIVSNNDLRQLAADKISYTLDRPYMIYAFSYASDESIKQKLAVVCKLPTIIAPATSRTSPNSAALNL